MIAQNTELAQSMLDRDRGQTAYTGLAADPKLVGQQRAALGEMTARARDGYTDLDRAAMQQQLREAARFEQSQRESLAADARARGVGGSGMDILSQRLAQQAAADRATDTGLNMALAGRDRAYAANSDAANLAASMRGQDFSERSQVAGAQDSYNQWRLGSEGGDAAMLMNARQGHAQNLNDRATQRENAFNEGVDQAVQVGGAIYGAFAGGGGGAAAGAGRTAAPTGGAPTGNQKTGARPPAPAAPAARAPAAPAPAATPAAQGPLGRRRLPMARQSAQALIPQRPAPSPSQRVNPIAAAFGRSGRVGGTRG